MAGFRILGAAVLGLSMLAGGCKIQNDPLYPLDPNGPQDPQAQQYGPGQLPPGYVPGQQLGPTFQMPPANMPPVPNDPITNMDMGWLRDAARGTLTELVAALPAEQQARVQGIPFVTDPKVGEVNAYAACDAQRQPAMAITDGLLQVQANISQLKATDEVFGTQKLDGYLQALAQYQKPNQPILGIPPGYIDARQAADYRKVFRQHALLEEQLAFVLGHELAHHYLGHTGCANGSGGRRQLGYNELSRIFSRVVPFVNQPNELAADQAGTINLLNAGARRQGIKWNEEGALLTLYFFAKTEHAAGSSLFEVFQSSHPDSQNRVAPIQQTANYWRASGGGR